jgi:glycine cleavage system H protein
LGTVPDGSQECVWMSSGVLSYRLCDSGFDCEHCLLDAALHARGPAAVWKPGDWGPSGYRLYPRDRQFSTTHAWVLPQPAGSMRVGVDALIAWLLAEPMALRLPAAGTQLERGEVAATLAFHGGEITIPSPLAGKVLARNDLALGCPELVTAAPYGAGWLLDLGLPAEGRKQATCSLLDGPDMEELSRAHLYGFHHRTEELLASRPARVGATLADGGEGLSNPRAMLGPAVYLRLVQELLV